MNLKSIIAVISGVIIVLAIGLFVTDTNPAPVTSKGETANTSTADLPTYLQADGIILKDMVDATGQSEVAATIDDFFFQESVLMVSVGTTVTWTNNGSAQHNVVTVPDSPKQGLDSPLLSRGETFSYTFTEVGTYNYLCEPHPTTMKAVVEVVN